MPAFALVKVGAACRNRTDDLFITSETEANACMLRLGQIWEARTALPMANFGGAPFRRRMAQSR